jgi:outer membrane protein OmpA-like peptidoglycan-associated protein
MNMRSAVPAVFAFAVLTTAAHAQLNAVPGMDPNPFPVLSVPLNQEEKTDTYKRLPYRDMASEIRIELVADALFDFDRGQVRASAADYLQQAANLIFEHAKGPVRIECRSNREPAAIAQKLGERCAAAISQWLTVQEKLTKVKFVSVGASVPPPAAPNRNDPLAPVPVSRSIVTIVFAKQ